MNRLFYPALFHIAQEGGFWVTFPDIPECMTEGDTMQEAYEMAVDALGLCITDFQKERIPLPTPSQPSQIESEPGSFMVVVEFNLQAYLKKHNNKSIKKTLTIPEWLNEAAMDAGINFSQALQEILVQKINIK